MRLVVLVCLLMCLSAPVCAEEPLADQILVEKSKRKMKLLHADKTIRVYYVMLGRQPVGPKIMEGDYKTPEGHYIISGRKQNSDYHMALQISYPDELDIERAKSRGVDPGGQIMIHGQPDDYAKRKRRKDWTHGCIAVTNREIEEIWRLVPDGTPIEIRP